MKNYNKILEAINKGIKFALDDFEDNEEIQGQSNSKVKYQGGINEYLDLMNNTVDLGLPSGTLWCKYNLGVNPTRLNTPEDWYGDYYEWGELEPNKLANWPTYKFGKKYNQLTKYCNNPEYGLNGFTDNLTQLLSEDDVAYQNKKFYNYKFHIPTKEQCEELIKYTTNIYWVKNYDPNKLVHNPEDDGGIRGLNGRVFIGKNRNQIFIPAAGTQSYPDIYNVGTFCYLWSSSLYLDSCAAYNLYFNSNQIDMDYHGRCFSFSVRPVINL